MASLSRGVLILDFGSQYTQLIARRVRETGVYSEIYAWDVDPSYIPVRPHGHHFVWRARIGNRGGVSAGSRPGLELGVPVLGICYGLQTTAVQHGGKAEPSSTAQFGHAEVTVQKGGQLLEGLTD